MDKTTCSSELSIAVVCSESLKTFSPTINLVSSLIELGNKVSLLACDIDCLPSGVASNSLFQGFELGSRDTASQKFGQLFSNPRKVRQFLRRMKNDTDLVWITSIATLRDAGYLLKEFNYVVQLAELVQVYPLFARRPMPLHSSSVVKLTREANRVVVPELNRSFIQQAWWDLPTTPAVLPNKPSIPDSLYAECRDQELKSLFEQESRKILLYQGAIVPDRNIEPFAEAVDMLGGEFALYLMGWARSDDDKRLLQRLQTHFKNTEYVGFVSAPSHLFYTQYGYIGLLPYTSSKATTSSPLNALYCAPNKIWEYAHAGLPMIGTKMPGLISEFSRNGIGFTAEKPNEIIDSINKVQENYEEMSFNSRNYFNSLDYTSEVESILKEALQYSRHSISDNDDL